MARKVKVAGIKNWDVIEEIPGKCLVQENDYVEILTDLSVEEIAKKLAGKVGMFQILEEDFEAEKSAQVSLVRDALEDAGINEIEISPETGDINVKVEGGGRLLYDEEDGSFQGAVISLPIGDSVVMIRVYEDGDIDVELER